MQTKDLLQQAQADQDWIVGLRRELHRFPELRYEEFRTSEVVRRTLTELDIPFEHPIATTGVVARLGNGNGPCVALRADMDALPIEEEADVDFCSENPGKMHACGHDCHTAMLLGAAKLLKRHEDQIQGTVKLLFQPAEEGGAGGRRMIKEGALENPQVERIFGLHVWPELTTGHVAGRSGPLLAAVGSFRIRVVGRGGHAAFPHTTHDPVMATAQIVSALQSIVSREIDPFSPAVVSVTALRGGEACNVIPPQVEALGTIRSMTTEGLAQLRAAIERIAHSTATAFRCTATLESVEGEVDLPATVNDATCWETTRELATDMLSAEQVHEAPPVLGGEDFSFYTQAVPGCFMVLGIRNPEIGAIHFLHHPKMKVDEAALPIGTAMHAAFAFRSLQDLALPSNQTVVEATAM
ncbi:MAG: amidohydrolase [Planctomycetaceae bacterium]|nr:MAG: amidohydrolase [Planctomycetaceae bacterium]